MRVLYLVFMIVFGILACLFFLCVCCGFRQLKVAIDTIDASADFVTKTRRIILVPVLFFFISIIFVMIWASAFACVVSMNNITAGKIVPQAKDLHWNDDSVKYMALFMFFGLLWLLAFLNYTAKFICMVSCSTYYFNSNAEKDGDAEVAIGFKFAVLHSGSIAFGAFILAVIQFIRIVFLYVAKKAERSSGNSATVKMVVACGACILKCIEKVCDYMNSAAFAYMAVSGDTFCYSAWNGFLLSVKHCLEFGFANLIVKIFVFLGKVAIVVANLFSLFFIMKNITHDTEEVSSLFGPMVVVGVVTFFTASIFLGLLDTAVMSMMTCHAIDMDLNGHIIHGPPTYHDGMSKAIKPKDKVAANEIN